jgi:hypothetical protein
VTTDEVIDLLTLMASFDRRTVGKADVAAWRLVIGELSFADAEQAVLAHYGDSREFAMPSDIRQRVKAIRAQRVRQATIPAPPPELADDPAEYQRVLTENIRKAADGDALPAQPERPAIAPAASERRNGPPVSLRSALTDLRRAIGPARIRRRATDPQAIAARQVAEQRAIDAERSKTEEAS